MPQNWSIIAEWEALDRGAPEESACFASLGIRHGNVWLTEGRDDSANTLRKCPRLSAYHMAEWFAWNWWRLRWEPRSASRDWAVSHRLSTIGYGYIWPNISVFSDGQQIAIIAAPTTERKQTPFRYIADHLAIITANEFENEVDRFLDQVLQRLDSQGVFNTNLETIWNSVSSERKSPEIAHLRKLEALLGHDPDRSDEGILKRLMTDSRDLGIDAVEEIAALHGAGGALESAKKLQEMAAEYGFDAAPQDTVHLQHGAGLPLTGEVAAWYQGAKAAQALRGQIGLNGHPISDGKLTEIAGAQRTVLTDNGKVGSLSFALDENTQHGKIVLRSKWRTGRRFELARVLGDRLVTPGGKRLFPATRAYTYRQKMQRSFAAEFLCPIECVDDFLKGDYSEEAQQEVADYFDVSEMTIRTLLVNHRRIDRIDREPFGDEQFAAVGF